MKWVVYGIVQAICIFFLSQKTIAADCRAGKSRQIINRFPVVFNVNQDLMGSPVGHLEAWRLFGKTWQQVPLQVDQVDPDGSYVLEEGLPYTKYNDDGFVDANDELSLRTSSFGDFFYPKQIPAKVLSRFKRSASVDFCNESGVYLGSVLIGETKEVAVAMPFEPLFRDKERIVETGKYRYQFRQGQPMLIGDVKIKTPQGYKDVFSGSSFVMPLIPRIFIFPSFYFGESDFASEIECWRSGPVRSIVAVGAKLKNFFSFLNLHLFSELVFYEDFFQIPTRIEFVFDPSRFLTRGSGLAYILRYPRGVDWRLDSNLEPLPLKGLPAGGDVKTAYDQSKEGKFAVQGSSPIGSFVANVRVDEKALRQAPPPYVVARDTFKLEAAKAAWPWIAGTQGDLGVFIEISGVKAGSYDFALDVALSNQADDGFADFQTVVARWPDPKER
jgi:hypothetical protein